MRRFEKSHGMTEKQQRLAMLRADTSGGHQTESAQLEKELADAQQSYQRTLEDQLLDRLQNQGDEAEKQRQRQIELLEAQGEIAKQLGTNLEQIRKWMQDPTTYYNEIRQAYFTKHDYDNATPAEQERIASQFEADFGKYLGYSEEVKFLKTIDDHLVQIIHRTDDQAGISHFNAEEVQQINNNIEQLSQAEAEKKKRKEELQSELATAQQKANETNEKKAAAEKNRDNAKAQLDTAEKNFAIAKARLERAKKSGNSNEIKRAKINYNNAFEARSYAQKQYNNAEAGYKYYSKQSEQYNGDVTRIQNEINQIDSDIASLSQQRQDLENSLINTNGIIEPELHSEKGQTELNAEADAAEAKRQTIQDYYDKAIRDFRFGHYRHMHEYGFSVGSPTDDATRFYEKVLRPLGKQLGYGPKEILTTLADKMGWDRLFPIVEEIHQKSSSLFDMDRLILTFQTSKDFQRAFNKSAKQKANLWDFYYGSKNNPYYGNYRNRYEMEYSKATLFDIALQEALRKGLASYKTGGLANYTGPAWLDGTPSKPELVLNATDTKNFLGLRDVLSSAMKSTSAVSNSYGGDIMYDINIHVDKIEKDYDVDRVVDKVKKEITKGAGYRNVTQVRNFR